MLTGTIARRTVAAVGAVALGMGAALGLSSTAAAEPQDMGNIDSTKPGSLTVHKYLFQDGDHEGDISAAPAAGDFSDPVAGVVFTVYPLLKDGAPLDLNVSTNWVGLDDLKPGKNCTAPDGYTLGAGEKMPATDVNGASTLARDVGLYQVCETYAPSPIVNKAPAFILTVPMPDKGAWVYDVHAYPKNGTSSLVKSIEAQEGLGLGATVKFPVTNTIPDMGTNDWTGYAIRDVLDGRLTANAENSGISSVTFDGVALDTAYYKKIIDGQTVTMEFTNAGLEWLNEGTNARAGKDIVVTFDTTVTEVGDGVIKNDAQLWTNNPNYDASVVPPVDAKKVTTNWGNLVAKKVANNVDGPALSGAVFEVYAAADPYAADCVASKTTKGNPISVNGATTFTSEDGIVDISGLFVSDSVNPSKDASQRCYVLKETVAPAGYILPEGDAALFPAAVTTGQTSGVDITIVNTQQKALGLPMTGAAGELLLVVAGLGLGGIVVGLMIVNRRRSAAVQS